MEKITNATEKFFENSKLWKKIEPKYHSFQKNINVPAVIVLTTILGIIGGLVDSYCTIEAAKLPSKVINGEIITSCVISLIVIYILNAIEGIFSRSTMKLMRNIVYNKEYYKLIEKEFTTNFRYIINSHTGKLTSEISGYIECKATLVMYIKRSIFFLPQGIVLFKKISNIAGIEAVLLDIAIIAISCILGYIGMVAFSYKKAISSNSNLRRITQDNMQSIKTLRYLSKKDFAMNRLKKAQDDAVIHSMMLMRQTVFAFLGVIASIIPIINIGMTNGTNPSLDDMTYIIVSSSMIFGSLIDIVIDIIDIVSQKNEYKSAIKQLYIVEEEKVESLGDGIKLKDVTFGYPESDIIMNINDIFIEKGKRYVITGESGQGKSTLANLLVGTLQPITGEVKHVKTFYIHQDTDCLDSSIRDNICFGEDISDEVLFDYLDKIGLGDWVRKLPKGLETPMGERGAKASSGQKQRVNILRSVFKMKEYDEECMIILDEPTSNLDTETEKLACELINESCKNTLIVVTHRPAIKEICDFEIKVENHKFELI